MKPEADALRSAYEAGFDLGRAGNADEVYRDFMFALWLASQTLRNAI